MGQRLNIEIMKNDKVLANAYYHWSAYTSSALELCAYIIEEIKNVPDVLPGASFDTPFSRKQIESAQSLAEKFKQQKPEIKTFTMPGTVSSADQDLLFAIRLLEGTGAGINEDEQERILAEGLCSGITFRSAIDRNTGLLSITEEGMNETRCWQERQATIDLDRRRVYFSVFFDYYTLEDYIEEYEIDLKENPEAKPATITEPLDFENFSFEDVGRVLDFVKKTIDTGVLLTDGRVLSWIA